MAGRFPGTADEGRVQFTLTETVDRAGVPMPGREVIEPPGMMFVSDLLLNHIEFYQNDIAALLRSVAGP